ncbi:methionine adenosyltransferase 2 subunit beta [Hydra vulgaris]|uniref:Methionine adenosyltransferase 2 subunit beta n=1 Tax=Hydra vulgaris TaxID=6087 RepID=A0ABM4D601_HYDVU
MKVVISGASGLLGRSIYRELINNTNWEVLGLGFTRLGDNLHKVDLCNEEDLKRFIEKEKPDVFIHSAAERRPDFVASNKEHTTQLNITSTKIISKLMNQNGGFVLYISTDYVFDGFNPPYKTTDIPNPLNEYGLSKREGEICILENCTNYGILRVPILYGEVQYLQESAVTGLFELLKDSKTPKKVSNYEQRFPTSTDDVAVVCRQIVEYNRLNNSFHGIWHWSSNEKMTKYKIVEIMALIFNLSMKHIEPDNEPSVGVSRPYDCELDCSNLIDLGIGKQTDFKENIKKYLEKFV